MLNQAKRNIASIALIKVILKPLNTNYVKEKALLRADWGKNGSIQLNYTVNCPMTFSPPLLSIMSMTHKTVLKMTHIHSHPAEFSNLLLKKNSHVSSSKLQLSWLVRHDFKSFLLLNYNWRQLYTNIIFMLQGKQQWSSNLTQNGLVDIEMPYSI